MMDSSNDPDALVDGDVDVSDVPVVLLNEGDTPERRGSITTDNSSYPCTPPNSRMDPTISKIPDGPDGLPSFNNSEMLKRIQEKKSELEGNATGETDGAQTFPFTPPNSFTEGAMFGKERLDESDMLKRLSGRLRDPVTPQNSMQEAEPQKMMQPYHTGEPYSSQRADEILDYMLKELNDHTPESKMVNVRAATIAEEMDLTEQGTPELLVGNQLETTEMPTANTGNVRAFGIANHMRMQELTNDIDPEIVDPKSIPSVADSTRPLHCVNASKDYLEYEGHDLQQVSEHVTDDIIQCAIDDNALVQNPVGVNGDDLRVDDGEFKVELSSSPTLTQSIQTFINEQKSSEPHDDTPQEDPRITQARRDVAREIVDEAMHAGVQMFLDGDQGSIRTANGDHRTTDNTRPNSLSGVAKKRLTAPVDLLNNSLHDNSSTSSVESHGPSIRSHDSSNHLRGGHAHGSGGQLESPDAEVDEILSSLATAQTPDDLNTPDMVRDFGGGLQLEDTVTPSPYTTGSSPPDSIPEWTAREEYEEKKNWRTVTVSGQEHRIDMKVIEPYKNVLSHGGYYGEGHNAIVVFSGCYLPDKGRRDYNYVMDNLFLYVVNTLELLVVEDYMIVYFHGATPKNKMPGLRWLRKCYDMLDRKLRKNLKRLLIVHPTLWLRTIMLMTRPFISAKFKAKIRYVHNLSQLPEHLPVQYVYVPDDVQKYDESKCGGPPRSASSPTQPTPLEAT